MLVTQACNPGYSGGRDQESCCSKPALANSSEDPISNPPHTHIHIQRINKWGFKPWKWPGPLSLSERRTSFIFIIFHHPDLPACTTEHQLVLISTKTGGQLWLLPRDKCQRSKAYWMTKTLILGYFIVTANQSLKLVVPFYWLTLADPMGRMEA
jgi:hypothetical protein